MAQLKPDQLKLFMRETFKLQDHNNYLRKFAQCSPLKTYPLKSQTSNDLRQFFNHSKTSVVKQHAIFLSKESFHLVRQLIYFYYKFFTT